MKQPAGSMYLYLLLWVLTGSAKSLAGDAVSAPAGPELIPAITTKDHAVEQVQEELTAIDRRWYGLLRVRWSYPQKFSAGLGAIFVELPRDSDCASICGMYGWHFEVEPGLYGVQGSVGYGKLVAETGNTRHLMHRVYLGWAVRGVVLRTWGDSPLKPQSQTLAGIEGNFSLLRVNYSLGILHSLSLNSSSDWIITAGIGWGF